MATTSTTWQAVSGGTNSGDWLAGANWTAGVPTATTATFIITPNGGTVTYDPSGGTNSVFSLAVESGSATLDIVSGTLAVLHAGGQTISGTLINSGVFEVSGGSQVVGAGVTNNGLIEVAGSSVSSANLELDGFNPQASGTISVGLNATVQFDTGMPATQTVKLTDGSAQLIILTSTSMAAPISGFGGSNIIDFTGVGYDSTYRISYSGNTSQGIVTIATSTGSVLATASFKGSFSAGSFGIEPDAANRLELYALGTSPTPCFVTGTRIATPGGDRSVQTLRPGDLVCLARGGAVPVIWVGHRKVACRLHPSPGSVHPVRVRAGAFAASQPQRDLLLSPDHAVFVQGLLVPIRHLVNDTSIVPVAMADVVYWHVELDEHDVVLAEGLPVESYLDRGNRHGFVNSGKLTTLHPDFAGDTSQARAYAPLTTQGPELDRIRRDITSRADERDGIGEMQCCGRAG